MTKFDILNIKKDIARIIVNAIYEVTGSVNKNNTLLVHTGIVNFSKLEEINEIIEENSEDLTFSLLDEKDFHLTVEEIIEKRVQEEIASCN